MPEICLKKESLIMIKNSLDKNQMFVFNLMIKAVFDNKGVIDINKICKNFNIDYWNAKKLISSLVDLKITKFKKENDISGVFVPIYQVKFTGGEAHFRCAEMFLEILQQKERYTLIDLHIQRLLPSKYSYIFYEIASLCFNKEKGIGYTEKYTIDEFKSLIGLESTDYPQYKILKRDIINKNLKSIEEITDFKLTLKEIKTGNKVDQIYFEIRKKAVKIQAIPLQTVNTEQKETILMTDELESKYSTDQILKAKEKLEKAKQTTTVKNDAKYIEKILINEQNKDSFTLTPELEKELKYKLLLYCSQVEDRYFIEMSEPYEYYDNSHFEEAITKMRSFKKVKNVDLGNIYSLKSSDFNKCYSNWEENAGKYKNRLEFCNNLVKVDNYVDINLDVANLADKFKV